MTQPDFALAHRLNSIIGWTELGNLREAEAELAEALGVFGACPEILDVQWMLEARRQDWSAALATAERLLALQPDNAASWLNRAYALRRAPGGGLSQAFAALRPAFERFPAEPVIPYNLACYQCQSGGLAEARRWLEEAVRRGGREAIRQMALRDADLAPLRSEIEAL